MIQLPKTKINPDDAKGYCKCRPVCKNRRREWKGEILKPSAELLLENKPVSECIRKWPKKCYPNSPCPLFAKNKRVVIVKRPGNYTVPQQVVRICPAPIDNVVPTPYLRAAELAKQNGALDLVQACCPFCMCGQCCECGTRIYPVNERHSEKKDMHSNFVEHTQDVIGSGIHVEMTSILTDTT